MRRMVVERVGGACLRHGVRRRRAAATTLRTLARRAATVLHDTRGVAAIEFAFVAPPFLLLVMGIIEVSLAFFTGSVIEGATKEAARQIRIGQVQESADPLAAFREELCDQLYGIIDCAKVVFHVQTFSDFQSVSMPLELDEDGEIVNTTFAPGTSGAVTVVRAMYRWEFKTPLVAEAMSAGIGGHLIVSTVAFQNEPYSVN